MALAIVMWTVLIVSLYGFNLWFVYQRTLPRSPNVETGNLHPRNVHGIVVYQTREQRDRLNRWDWWPFGILVGLGGVFAILEKLYGERPDAFTKLREKYGRVPDGFR